jgi:hypothetical protein
MKRNLERLGNAAAAAGLLLCLASGAGRVLGAYYIAGFEAMTLYTGGMGLMLAACLQKLHVLSRDR